MWICKECGEIFEEPCEGWVKAEDDYKNDSCPWCDSEDIEEAEECEECGEYVASSEIWQGICDKCGEAEDDGVA